MATLEKIRSKGVLLLIIVGLALFSFIIGDFINSGSTYFGQKRQKVATINNEDIKIDEFLKRIDQLTTVYKIEVGESNINNEETTEQIRASVWESLIRERIIAAETQSIGMVITKEELFDRILGSNPHPILQQRRAFIDPKTGLLDNNALAQFISVLDSPEGNMPEETKTYWSFWENAIKNSTLEEKYNTLLSKAIVTNTLEAELNIELNKNKVDFAYIIEPYFAIPDSAINVSKNEIEKQYKKDLKKYKKNTPICDINYVAFDIKAQKEDLDNLEKWINGLAPEFKTTDDVIAMVNSNSDTRFINTALSKNDIEVELRDFAFKGKKGETFGPYFTNNYYKIARIIETGINRPDSIKIRHIYISEDTPERTKELADSLLIILQKDKGKTFANIAKKYSKVAQTAENGGEIGWIREPEIDGELAEKAFNVASEAIFTMQANPNAIQIFQVTQKGANTQKVKLAVIERLLTPSSRTQAKIYNEAKKFAASCKTIEDFTQKAQEQGLAVLPALSTDINDSRIGDVKNSRQVVRWAFEQEKNKVSDVFECENKFIVAAVNNINKGDHKTIDEVSNEIKSKLVKEKKGEIILEKITGKNYESLVAQGANTDTIRNIMFETFQAGSVGAEPMLFAAAVSGKEKPVKGNSGVYLYKIINNIPSNYNNDIAAEKNNRDGQIAYMMPFISIEILKEKANIKDNRSIIF